MTSDFKRFTFRINSEHVLWKKGDLEIVKFGENLYYQHKENQGIKIGNMYANDISYMLRANPCVPVMSGGKYTMYENLNKAMTNPEKTFLYVSILASDDCLGGGGGNDQHMQACDLLRNSGANMTRQFWIDRYEGIQRANNLIASLEDKADELKKRRHPPHAVCTRTGRYRRRRHRMVLGFQAGQRGIKYANACALAH